MGLLSVIDFILRLKSNVGLVAVISLPRVNEVSAGILVIRKLYQPNFLLTLVLNPNSMTLCLRTLVRWTR